MYGTPVPALQYAANERHFSFELKYCEVGSGLVGEATEKDYKAYFLTGERPPEEDGIPGDLSAEFNLNKVFAESQE